MKRKIAVVAALAAVPLLAGCYEPPNADNHDPRKGRVTINWRADFAGVYEYDWKVCVGGDLLMNINGQDWWIRPSAECQT